MTTLNNATLSYDVENRLTGYTTGTFAENYAYDEGNRRVEKWNSSGSDNIYFYGPSGKLLTVVQVNVLGSSPWMTLSTLSNRVYFGGMLLGTTTGYAVSDADLIKDRLGSVQPSYAYGTDTGSGQQTSPGDDFATYWKDSSTGFEYAMNRYYSTGYGRFLTADPFGGSARARNPGSMNRYTYSLSDPVNSVDQSGLCAASYAEICDGGYCPPEVQYCDPGPPGTDYGINDPSQPNCGGNPQFVDGDTGDTLNSGDGCVTPVGTPPNPPQCSISVYERPTPGRWSPGDHTYLYAQDGSVGEYFEGGPTNPIKNLFGNYGTLWGFDSLNPATNLNGRSPLSGDNTSTNTWLGSWSGAEACVDIGLISFWISVYDNGPQPKYHPLWGYNSNSFTYTLLYQLGLAGDFQPIGWAPDLGKLVPGL